jgi:hypothetical protein
MKKLMRVDTAGVSLGIAPAQDNSAVSAWQQGMNTIFREGAARPEPGQLSLFMRLDTKPVIGLGQVERGGRPILFWGQRDKLFRGDLFSATPVTDASDIAYSGIADQTVEKVATRWSLQGWGEWMVAANGIDELRIFKPSNTVFRPLGHASVFGAAYHKPPAHTTAGVAFKPTLLVRAKTHILAFTHHVHASSAVDNEILDGEQTYWWCDDNNIAEWVPDPSNAAGSNIIKDAPSPIVAAKPYLDGAAAFTLNTCHLVQYLGDPFWFGTVRTLTGIGAFGESCVVAVGRFLYGLGPKGFWRTDGTEYQYYDHPRVRDWYLTRVNLEQASKIVAWHDPTNDRVVWFFPAVGSLENSSAIGFDYDQNTWHMPTYARSAAAAPEAFIYPIVGDLTGNIWQQSFQGTPATPVANPISFTAAYTLELGYGEGGYGGGGYGGLTGGNG